MPKFSRDKELKSYLCPGASFFVHFPAFRTLFLGEQDNFIHLPADHAEKPLISEMLPNFLQLIASKNS